MTAPVTTTHTYLLMVYLLSVSLPQLKEKPHESGDLVRSHATLLYAPGTDPLLSTCLTSECLQERCLMLDVDENRLANSSWTGAPIQ